MLSALPPAPPAEAIVVTGKALPDRAAESAYHVDINRRQLADAPASELDSILLQVPGLQLFRRSDSTSGHPTSQGVTLRALGGNASSRALLILDGVPQSDPFGGWVNWPAYDSAGLGEVRISPGGGNVAFGPGAIAGVIEMRSLAEPSIEASLAAGSRRSLKGHVYGGRSLGTGLVTIDGQLSRGDGFVPVTAATRGPADRAASWQQASLRGRWIVPVAGDTELQLGGLAFVDSRDRGLRFTGNRTRGADLSMRLVGRGSWQWAALGYGQWRNLRSSFASVDEARTTAIRVALQDSVPSAGYGGGLEMRPPVGSGFDLRFGADARFVDGESRELFSYSGGEPTRRRIAGGRSATQGLYVEGGVRKGPLTLDLALRLDHWRIWDGQLLERPLAGGSPTRDDSFPSRAGWQPTARVGAAIELANGTTARFAAYRGWRLPTLNELFRPFRAGPDATAANPQLDPETLSGVEAGLHHARGAFDFSLTAFLNRLSQAIANVTLDHGPGVFPGVGFVAGDFRQRRNLNAIRVRGIEAGAGIRHGPWSLRAGASLTDARVDGENEASALDGLRPAQTPKLVLTGAASWQLGEHGISVQVRHVGAQYEDDLNHHRLPPATTVDAFATWPLTRQLQMFGRAQNLFNHTIVAGLDDDGTVERATPRTLWLGLRLRSNWRSQSE